MSLCEASRLKPKLCKQILKCFDDALKHNDESYTIILAWEDNKEHEVSKAGLRTFTGEWFMQVVVKQKNRFEWESHGRRSCIVASVWFIVCAKSKQLSHENEFQVSWATQPLQDIELEPS